MLTSGELAKKCQISLRTVQFYDQKGLVKPSCVVEGNKRLYDEEAIHQMYKVCLFRTLGFSLEETKHLLQEKDMDYLYTVIKEKEALICKQQEKLDEQYSFLESMLDSIQHHDEIGSFEELAIITKKRKEFHKKQVQQYIFLIIFLIVEMILFVLSRESMFLMLIASFIVLILLIFLIRLHARHNAYICPNCHTYFELTIGQDATHSTTVQKVNDLHVQRVAEKVILRNDTVNSITSVNVYKSLHISYI